VADRYYYSHAEQKLGPCSDQQLKDLAAAGGILPTDTVWKEGIERGVDAGKVKNLFRAAPARPPVEVEPEPVAPAGPALAEPPVPAPAPRKEPRARQGRATAGRGAVLVSQDGVSVKFRKKCTTCGHLDTSWNTIPIRNGIMRAGFYCIKCRKHRDVEVHGNLS